ncbi:MAG: hypothetical protein ACOCQD_00255 [archaeon]
MTKIVNKSNIHCENFVIDGTEPDTAVSIPDYAPSIGKIIGGHYVQLSDGSPNTFGMTEFTIVTDADDLDTDQLSQVNSREIRTGNDFNASGEGQEALVTIVYEMK